MDDDPLSQAMWLADNLSSFAGHAAACLLAISLAMFLSRSPRFAIFVFVLAAPFAFLVALAVLTGAPVGACDGPGPRLRIASVNLLISNTDREAVAAFLAGEQPDVVAFLEVGDFWNDALPALTAAWPYRAESPRGATRIYSRLPFASAPRPGAVSSIRRSVGVDMAVDGAAVTIIAAHMAKPTTAGSRQVRRAQMDALGALATAAPHPAVVVGDFNAAPTSLDFRALIAASPLRAPVPQMPPVATWPARFGPFGIQIDHVLASAPVAFERVAAGARTGSNHRPIVADLALAGCAGR